MAFRSHEVARWSDLDVSRRFTFEQPTEVAFRVLERVRQQPIFRRLLGAGADDPGTPTGPVDTTLEEELSTVLAKLECVATPTAQVHHDAASLTQWPEDADFERTLQRMAAWYASQPGERELEAFWTSRDDSANWIVERILRESHVDVLAAASSALRYVGHRALTAILYGLRQPPSDAEQIVALLRPLSWLATSEWRTEAESPLREVLRSLLDSRSSDVREAAVEAAAVLGPDAAHVLLQSALEREKNPDVRDSIRDALGD